jgi:hypothetical protein
MKKLLKLSRIIHIVLLLSFFLPFYPIGCDNKSAEIAKAMQDSLMKDSIMRDSIIKIETIAAEYAKLKADSIAKTDSIAKVANNGQLNSLKTITTRAGDNEIERKSFVGKCLKFILLPNDNFSGFGYIIFAFGDYLKTYGVITAFLFLIIGLILKSQKNKSLYWLVCTLIIFSILGFLCNIYYLKGEKEILWGYKTCLILMIIQLILDLTLTIKIKTATNTV